MLLKLQWSRLQPSMVDDLEIDKSFHFNNLNEIFINSKRKCHENCLLHFAQQKNRIYLAQRASFYPRQGPQSNDLVRTIYQEGSKGYGRIEQQNWHWFAST